MAPGRWVPWLRSYAEHNRCALEDPYALHRAFPHLPVPGTAVAVLRGAAPGTDTTMRLTWHTERNVSEFNVGSNGVLLPAAAGAPDTERTPDPQRRGQYGVKDGVFAVSTSRRWKTQEEGMGDIDWLVGGALELARETGLARL